MIRHVISAEDTREECPTHALTESGTSFNDVYEHESARGVWVQVSTESFKIRKQLADVLDPGGCLCTHPAHSPCLRAYLEGRARPS